MIENTNKYIGEALLLSFLTFPPSVDSEVQHYVPELTSARYINMCDALRYSRTNQDGRPLTQVEKPGMKQIVDKPFKYTANYTMVLSP